MAKPGNKTVGRDVTEGKILPLLVSFVLPILLANVIQQLYNMVDMMVIGMMGGSTGTVGVSTGGEIVNFMTFISTGFSSGAQIYIAQLRGAREHKKISETIGSAFTLMILMSLIFMAFIMIFCRPLLNMLNTPQESMTQAYQYMMITALGLPFIYGYNIVCAMLRGLGESKRPLQFVLVSAISNIFLDLLFVVGLQMDVVGTAWATVIAQIAAFVASVIFMYRKREAFDFDVRLSSFMMKKEHLAVLFKLGIPLAASSSFIHISQLYCNSRVNEFGLVMSAVNSIGNKIVRFANILTTSINTGCAAMIGQNLGARKYDRVKEIVRTAFMLAFGVALINVVLCILCPQIYFMILSQDPAVIEQGRIYMRISIITFLLSAWQGPFQGVINGCGYARLSFIVGMLDGVILRIGISLLLADVVGMGVYGFFFGNALARLAPCIICTAYYMSGKWKYRKLLSEQKK